VTDQSQLPVGEVNRQALDASLEMVAMRVASHAGGIEVVGLSDDGALELRFTGMCAGCPYRPLTMAVTIRPALLAVKGITQVVADGARVSEEAAARLSSYMAEGRRDRSVPDAGPTTFQHA